MQLPFEFEKMNRWGKEKKPFFFLIDFLKKQPQVLSLDEIDPTEIRYKINKFRNYSSKTITKDLAFSKKPLPLQEYQKSFDSIKEHLQRGDSFLTNLTCSILINTNYDLLDIFYTSKAPYKIWYKDQWVCYSPETFIEIKNGRIYSFPMKGTIDASLPNAKETILNNPKEKAEHYTIVDLIRNDLSQVATDVRVDKFRYLDKITTNKGLEILQVSSQISGKLPANYTSQLGTIFNKLLPAGSISGAPKDKTVDIILNTETHQRGFYTGVAGFFDGKKVESCVLIRFIEKTGQDLLYKAGGGITHQSQLKEEYQETLQKVYVPVT